MPSSRVPCIPDCIYPCLTALFTRCARCTGSTTLRNDAALNQNHPSNSAKIVTRLIEEGKLERASGRRTGLSTTAAQIPLELVGDLVTGQRLQPGVARALLQLPHVLGQLGVLLGGQ